MVDADLQDVLKEATTAVAGPVPAKETHIHRMKQEGGTRGQGLKVVLHPDHDPGLRESLGLIDEIELISPASDKGVRHALKVGAPILVTFEWHDSFLKEGLRWVHSISSGVEQFPQELLRKQAVVLTSGRGAHTPAVALHGISLLLALVRGIGVALKAGPASTHARPEASELSGRTLGVLGLGSVGEEVARLGSALGMRVIGTKRHPGEYEGVVERVWGPDATSEVCALSDAIVITLPGGPETAGAVGRAELEALGRGWLVNVGRGTTVEEDALTKVLQSGQLLGAALDVTREEPLPSHSPLWTLPNVILTPHMAWSSDRLGPRAADVFRQNLNAYLGLGPWITRLV
jgi:phosphoglycerate dehydrogenase-like enzyme